MLQNFIFFKPSMFFIFGTGMGSLNDGVTLYEIRRLSDFVVVRTS